LYDARSFSNCTWTATPRTAVPWVKIREKLVAVTSSITG